MRIGFFIKVILIILLLTSAQFAMPPANDCNKDYVTCLDMATTDDMKSDCLVSWALCRDIYIKPPDEWLDDPDPFVFFY